MYVIKNRITGQFASRDWFISNATEAWCELEVAQAYRNPDLAQSEIDQHAVPGTCHVVEFHGIVDLAGD